MSLRNMEVQYIGDTLYLPPLEREVKHIIVREVKDLEHFEPERTCKNISTTIFRCSECDAADFDYDKPSYCHGCGAKVVKE